MYNNLLPSNFDGNIYRLANNWFNIIPIIDYPINYLEIGAYHGANIISVANSYAKHINSHLYCIDPWVDYNDYPEYKGEQNINYNKFVSNICSLYISLDMLISELL